MTSDNHTDGDILDRTGDYQAGGASLGNQKLCQYCGSQIDKECIICPSCGHQIENFNTGFSGGSVIYNNDMSVEKKEQILASPKKKLVALLLCFFLGGFGAHRFYTGKIKSGILMIPFTFLRVGFIWQAVDFVMILSNKFTDCNGLRVVKWK